MRTLLGGILLYCLLPSLLHAQDQNASGKSLIRPQAKNFFKVNLYGLPARNFSIQAERVISKRVSLALGYRLMPEGSLPYRNQLLSLTGSTDENTREQIRNIRAGNSAITPEVRFYLGKKGYGRGFYVAPFYRVSKFTASDISIDFTNSSNTTSTLAISGKVISQTLGLQMGAQWALGKHITLDWWIFGPQYGKATGELTGVPGIPLTTLEQDNLRTELQKLDLPFSEEKVTVTASSARLTIDGPFGGIRTGLALGVRF